MQCWGTVSITDNSSPLTNWLHHRERSSISKLDTKANISKVPCKSLNEKYTEWKPLRQDFNGSFVWIKDTEFQPLGVRMVLMHGKQERGSSSESFFFTSYIWGKYRVVSSFLQHGFPILNYSALLPPRKKLHPSSFAVTCVFPVGGC